MKKLILFICFLFSIGFVYSQRITDTNILIVRDSANFTNGRLNNVGVGLQDSDGVNLGQMNDSIEANAGGVEFTDTVSIIGTKYDIDTVSINVLANTGKDTTGIYHSNRAALDLVSGTNTGDQVLTGYLEFTDTVSIIGTKYDIDTVSINVLANTGKDTTGIYHSNRAALDLVSGTNTGDQVLTGYLEFTDTVSIIGTKYDIDTVSINVLANTGKDTTGIYHSNRAALDLVSGTNTGDQVLTGYLEFTDTTLLIGTKYDIDTLINGTDGYIPNYKGTSAFEDSPIYTDGVNVGIGTTIPATDLDIVGSDGLRVSAGVGTGAIKIVPYKAGHLYHEIKSDGGNEHIAFSPGNSEAMRIMEGTGRVGIGTIAPTAALHIKAGTASEHFLIEQDGTGDAYLSFLLTGVRQWNYGIDNSDSDKFKIGTGSSLTSGAKLTIDDISGNVGIGTIAPTAALHIKAGTATASTAPLKFTSGTNLTTPEAGAMEFDGTNLFFTPSTTRETILFASDAVQFADNETPTGTVNGVNDTFTLANTPTTSTTHVYVNGVRQALTLHYTESTNTIVFGASYIPQTGDILRIDYKY